MYFTEEHVMFREGFRKFLETEVVPFIDTWESQGEIDRSIWKKMGDQGFLGLCYPEKYGGANLDFFFDVILFEEIRYISQSSCANFFAIAFPIPLLAPVITIFLFFILLLHKFDNVLTLL